MKIKSVNIRAAIQQFKFKVTKHPKKFFLKVYYFKQVAGFTIKSHYRRNYLLDYITFHKIHNFITLYKYIRLQMPEEKDLKTMPVRQYLDHTVVPTILQALTELAKQRPEKPIEFVANYLMKHAEGSNGKNNKDED